MSTHGPELEKELSTSREGLERLAQLERGSGAARTARQAHHERLLVGVGGLFCVDEPLVLLEKTERFDIFANLHGGGISGQAGALRLAIARALIEVDSEDRPPLKRAGFLTRDPRVIERKKYGLKKARKAPQYSKR